MALRCSLLALVAGGFSCTDGTTTGDPPCVEVQSSTGSTDKCKALCAPESVILEVDELEAAFNNQGRLVQLFDVGGGTGRLSFNNRAAFDNQVSTELLQSEFHVLGVSLKLPDENFAGDETLSSVMDLDLLSWEDNRLRLEASYVETYVWLDLCPDESDGGPECACGYETNIPVEVRIDAPLDLE